MQPQLPDTAVFRALSALDRESLEDELRRAERLVTAAQTYLEWIRLTAQARLALDELTGTARIEQHGDMVAQTLASMREKLTRDTTAAVRRISEPGKPPLRRAILMILHEEQHRRWRKRELLDELNRRGWMPEGKTPDKQLTNRLTEMAKRGEVHRHGPGVVSAASSHDLAGATSLGGGGSV